MICSSLKPTNTQLVSGENREKVHEKDIFRCTWLNRLAKRIISKEANRSGLSFQLTIEVGLHINTSRIQLSFLFFSNSTK